ncbi:MAG: hypothetical protein LBQ90_13010 [Synergistaceae bacterium]|nr:hypothetical protein [Synergistaceae bacterium]
MTRYNVTINDHTDQFRCVVSNEGGSVTSGAATLTVSTTDGGGNNYGGSSSGGGGCEVGFSFGFAVMALGLATLKGRKKH